MFDNEPKIENMTVPEMFDWLDYLDFCEELDAGKTENDDECGF